MTAERAARLDALGCAWVGSTSRSDDARWEAWLALLAAYKSTHGDCNVPQGWAEDPSRGRWVDKQRPNTRKMDRGEPGNGMTAERAARLTALGFAWEGIKAPRNEVEWEAQLARLAAYKAAHDDCNVPKRWAEDPRLGNWVNNQRRLKRKLDRGEPCKGMTADQAARLAALGLVWNLV
jgi:hypothetical protein